MGLPIGRDAALALLREHNSSETDMVHFLESEAVMAALARRLGEDEKRWAMLGLLHDIDWGLTKHETTQHLTKAPELLRHAGFDDEFIQDVLSHGYGWDCAGLKNRRRTRKVEFALAAAETITGLIHAYALMRGGRVSDMEPSGLKKKFKDKAFAAAVGRDIIRECEQLGLPLDEFFALAIGAIAGIKEQVGLQ